MWVEAVMSAVCSRAKKSGINENEGKCHEILSLRKELHSTGKQKS